MLLRPLPQTDQAHSPIARNPRRKAVDGASRASFSCFCCSVQQAPAAIIICRYCRSSSARRSGMPACSRSPTPSTSSSSSLISPRAATATTCAGAWNRSCRRMTTGRQCSMGCRATASHSLWRSIRSRPDAASARTCWTPSTGLMPSRRRHQRPSTAI